MDIEYAFFQLGSDVVAVSSPMFLSTLSLLTFGLGVLRETESLNGMQTLSSSTMCVSSSGLATNAEHSTIQTKKMNFQ